MPTIPANVTLNTNVAAMLNAIRAHASLTYQERVPVATQDTIKETGEAIMAFQSTANDFLDALINRIAMVLITSKSYQNPLREFKRGILGYGESIEELFVSLIKAQEFDPAVAEKEVYKRNIPDVPAAFHKLNLRNFYKVTISEEQLSTAFLSADGVLDLIGRIVDTLYTSAELDEFLTMKQLIANDANAGKFYPIGVGEITADNAKTIVTKIKQVSNQLEFMSGRYNYVGVPTHSKKDEQVLLIDAQLDALIDVEVLASAFNMSKAEFMGRRVLIDEFTGLSGVYAALIDKTYFMVFDKLVKTTEQYNSQGLYWNYFYHVWKIMSTSPFANAVLFTKDTPSVTLAPIVGDATAKAGDTKSYACIVSSTAYADKSITWNAINETTQEAVPIANGKITFPEATAVIITATSVFDPTKKQTKRVTVS